MRILVTGSRHWTDRAAIALAISGYLTDQGTGRAYPFPVVVHGAARGADACADAVARHWGWTPEGHPAAWATCAPDCHHTPARVAGRDYCPTAGHRRNQLMVDLGADVCLAFPLPGSRGTWDCVDRAKAADIPVRVAADSRAGGTVSRRVSGCWACEGPPYIMPQLVPNDGITRYLIALHELLGHDKAEAMIMGPGDNVRAVQYPITTVRPAARYL